MSVPVPCGVLFLLPVSSPMGLWEKCSLNLKLGVLIGGLGVESGCVDTGSQTQSHR